MWSKYDQGLYKKIIFKFDGRESNFFYREHRHKKITTMAPKKL